jgi:hypothetical protein
MARRKALLACSRCGAVILYEYRCGQMVTFACDCLPVEDALTDPIEHVRESLRVHGIDTQPLKDYAHAELAKLRAARKE